jgi:hypothetical protein
MRKRRAGRPATKAENEAVRGAGEGENVAPEARQGPRFVSETTKPVLIEKLAGDEVERERGDELVRVELEPGAVTTPGNESPCCARRRAARGPRRRGEVRAARAVLPLGPERGGGEGAALRAGARLT